MRTISAIEIKRRGVSAIEEALKNGPVHIIKKNRLACVVLSEEDYALILEQQNLKLNSLWNLLDKRPWQGERSKKNIDSQMQQERDCWND